MLSIDESSSLEEAGEALLDFIAKPAQWVALAELGEDPRLRPGQNPSYQRRVGTVKICASVDISSQLDVYLRIGFRGPGLTPTKAADHLEKFLARRLPLLPNTEWQVEVDERRWIHFIRRWVGPTLQA